MITAELTNTGETLHSDLVGLRVDGRLVATKGVRVGAGETAFVTFERSFDNVGDHEITVGDRPLPTVSVVEPAAVAATETSAGTPETDTTSGVVTGAENVAVVETRGLADWVRSGYNASVGVTLLNRGDRTAAYTLRVRVDGRTVASEPVRLPPGETTVSVEFPATAGTVRVGDTEVGTLSVGEAWNVAEEGNRATTAGGGPGFGAGSVVLAVAAVVAVTLRRLRPRRRGE